MIMITIISLVGLFSCSTEQLRLLSDSLTGAPRPQMTSTAENNVRVRAKGPVSGADVSAILQGYSDGKSTKSLAAEYCRSRTTISNILKRNHVKARALARPSDSDVARMSQLYESGLSLENVGKEVGFSAKTVYTHLLRKGITVRSTSRVQS